jgi:putative transposase
MKKVPVVNVVAPDIAAVMSGLPDNVTLALGSIAETMREGLMAFTSAAGLAIFRSLLDSELEAKIGAKHAKNPDRVGNWHGTTSGQVVFGGSKITVARPRGRTADNAEIGSATWDTFADDDLLSRTIVERMLAGVATRRHVSVGDPVGEQLHAAQRSMSKSAVSRRFIAATEAALTELLARDLTDLDVCVLMIDGVHFADDLLVVAMVITTDGTKIPVGVVHGDTENATIVKALLADLVARGLNVAGGILVVIDGAKALRSAVKSVIGEHAVVQRCTIHKRRNVTGYLPTVKRGPVDRRLAQIFAEPKPGDGKRKAELLAKELELSHPDAAASLREGLDEMFTVASIGASPLLRKSLSTSNAIESMISIARTTTSNVKNWKDGTMAKRWCAVGMLEAERSFRKLRGHTDLKVFAHNLRTHINKQTETPTSYNQHVA